jgi:hypothetical protein
MTRRLPLAGLLGLVLLTGLAVAVLGSQGHRSRVYTVAELRAGLHQDPGTWVGRTLRVRGVVMWCGATLTGLPTAPCIRGLAVLRGVTGAGEGSSLLLGRGQPDPAYAPLRGIPLLGYLLPAPAAFHWGVPATYTVEIVALPAARPDTKAMYDYEALLQDAAP